MLQVLIFGLLTVVFAISLKKMWSKVKSIEMSLYDVREREERKRKSIEDRLSQIEEKVKNIPFELAEKFKRELEEFMEEREKIEVIDEGSLSPAKVEILELLMKEGVMTSAEIAKRVGRVVSNVSKDLGELEKAGLVIRDKRTRPYKCYLEKKIKVVSRKKLSTKG